jgi:hypothetical protein
MRASRIGYSVLIAAFAVSVAACERPREVLLTAPNPHTVRLPSPDPSFRLTPEERASIRSGFDAAALERLLAAIEPGARPGLLHSFVMPTPGPHVSITIKMGDPTLQPLLDEVWLPFWESQPARLRRFYPDDGMWPGLELARQRAGIRKPNTG